MSGTPFWSVMIPTYRATHHLDQALQSVLRQAPTPEDMQIEIVDDASDDVDMEARIRRIAGDRVGFHRQPRNLGLAGNWNDCIRRAQGEWIHLLHQDDWVEPGFYQACRAQIEAHPEAGAVFTRAAFADVQGRQLGLTEIERDTPGLLNDWIEKIGVKQRILCASIVVRRTVYEQLGGFCSDLVYALDWEMWRRIACRYPVAYIPDVLATWRLHPASESPRLAHHAVDIEDIAKSIAIVAAYLPPDVSASITAQARRNYALHAAREAGRHLLDGQLHTALAKWLAGVRLSRSIATALHASWVFVLTALQNLRAKITSSLKSWKP